MTNAELFKRVFGMYATEMWSMPEDDFLNWINLDFGKRQWEWIEHKEDGVDYIECPVCGMWFLRLNLRINRYCPKCGEKMIDPQESEGKE